MGNRTQGQLLIEATRELIHAVHFVHNKLTIMRRKMTMSTTEYRDMKREEME
uniref:Uncharacterized protein n=1 Tax=Arundo donax TaxID=35708 RepID=A0A0A8ZVM0_ARUDO